MAWVAGVSVYGGYQEITSTDKEDDTKILNQSEINNETESQNLESED